MKIIKHFSILIFLIFPLFLMGCSATLPDNHAPVINSNPVTSSSVGVPYTYDVEATDADGDTL
jgi:hypothetical protein